MLQQDIKDTEEITNQTQKLLCVLETMNMSQLYNAVKKLQRLEPLVSQFASVCQNEMEIELPETEGESDSKMRSRPSNDTTVVGNNNGSATVPKHFDTGLHSWIGGNKTCVSVHAYIQDAFTAIIDTEKLSPISKNKTRKYLDKAIFSLLANNYFCKAAKHCEYSDCSSLVENASFILSKLQQTVSTVHEFTIVSKNDIPEALICARKITHVLGVLPSEQHLYVDIDAMFTNEGTAFTKAIVLIEKDKDVTLGEMPLMQETLEEAFNIFTNIRYLMQELKLDLLLHYLPGYANKLEGYLGEKLAKYQLTEEIGTVTTLLGTKVVSLLDTRTEIDKLKSLIVMFTYTMRKIKFPVPQPALTFSRYKELKMNEEKVRQIIKMMESEFKQNTSVALEIMLDKIGDLQECLEKYRKFLEMNGDFYRYICLFLGCSLAN